MKLEGTLDAFSLPDIFSLLSATKKSGTLHVRREHGRHGAIHLREGAITGARAQVERQELGRRLVGAGLVDDATLSKAVEKVSHKEGAGLGRMLADTATLDVDTVQALAAEQAVDAVFDLLRWTEGEFAFVADEPDPDDLGASLTVEQVVTEARRRLDAWPSLAAVVPSPDSVVTVAQRPAGEPTVAAADWWLLALVDGRRSVGELVALSGKGEYAVVSALAGLVSRGLLEVRHSADEALTSLHRRQTLLAGLEGVPVPTAPPAAARAAAADGHPAAARRCARPGHPRAARALRRSASARARRARTRLRPQRRRVGDRRRPALLLRSPPVPTGRSTAPPRCSPSLSSSTTPGLSLDPSVNKSLLLRLIAGVRGL